MIYQVSRILLSHSTRLSEILDLYSVGEPIPLIGVRSFEVESFLNVLHARQTESPLQLTVQEWGSALYISTRWGFTCIREHIIKQIEEHYEDQHALDRFELAMKCRVSQWLHPTYNTFYTRDGHITADEGRRLGYERLTAICKIREIFRTQEKTDCRLSCDDCQLQVALFSASSSRPDAMLWITEELDLKAVFPGEIDEALVPLRPSSRVVTTAPGEGPLEREIGPRQGSGCPNSQPKAALCHLNPSKEVESPINGTPDSVSPPGGDIKKEKSTVDQAVNKSTPPPPPVGEAGRKWYADGDEESDAHPCPDYETLMTRIVTKKFEKGPRKEKVVGSIISWVCHRC
ncbi:hypothetical protein FRB94_005566 [Tulasnella sp. JGI-2019a]|nr:hypothetical protein FRB94_005566 [Tulasnella sp. JGI-2019a]